MDKQLEQMARDEGIKVAYFFDRNKGAPKGGVTVAWKYALRPQVGRMVEVSVSYCSIKDTFTKKIGRQKVLENFFAERNTMLLPFGSKNLTDTLSALQNAFDPRYYDFYIKA